MEDGIEYYTVILNSFLATFLSIFAVKILAEIAQDNFTSEILHIPMFLL